MVHNIDAAVKLLDLTDRQTDCKMVHVATV